MENLLSFIKSYENGVTEEQILVMNPTVTKEILVDCLNKMLKNNNITVYKNQQTIYYKATINASDEYETLIINLISQSGIDGIWIKEIREKTNIPQNLIIKILRGMESRQVIKSIKNIRNNRKVYVLYDIIPSDDITGGYWFTDNDLDSECIENVSKILISYIKNKTFIDNENVMNKFTNNPSLLEITEYINGLNFLTSKVKEDDLRLILNTLADDEKIEILNDGDFERYRILQ